jgi:hypothetical protein
MSELCPDVASRGRGTRLEPHPSVGYIKARPQQNTSFFHVAHPLFFTYFICLIRTAQIGLHMNEKMYARVLVKDQLLDNVARQIYVAAEL